MNPTEKVKIGQGYVTRLGLGLAPLGGLFEPVGDDQARRTVDRAWELGLRFFDVAPLYGNGLAERRGGAALADRPRDAFTLSTKVGRLLRRGGTDVQDIWAESSDLTPVFDFSSDGVRRSYAESLSRLRTDRVDILHLHDPDDHLDQAVAEALPALAELRDQGRIGAVSAGMNQAEALVRLVRTGLLDAVLLAGRYTLLDQSGAAELLPLCAERGVAVIAAGVFNSGLLADPRPGARYDYLPADAALVGRALAIQAVCERHEVPLRAAAIQFPAAHPTVTSVLVGARNPGEIEDAVRMAAVPIPAELWSDLRREGLIE
ncbi:putative aldo/keto reductase [Actinoplanes missouriensis 431]|uniref:Putative aldo/keto reductase n=1 Tax=Actinoplanes missouriensis (strain ATCC 14538 / DSM 43046 / CBS 188.64 / JCM 3121 / NBRC 102363 / NCIMB 12654 / NRRL B-3342 / UNCC 431) TaxID=512565 RepID=I0H595_ACTM4|nr:aldo/keto reductase [Actinoplanes missouriensis]BAL88182.1 putative aldo/keto reductase [Actinoplanes missouriensis 431]